MTAFINVAFAQYNFAEGNELNTLSTMAVAFDLLSGSMNIAQADFQGLLDSPVPIRAYINYGFASAVALSQETRAALARLENLNELYHSSRYEGAAPTPTPSDDLCITIASDTPATPWKVTIGMLRHCFAEEQRGVLRGFCFVFPGGSGPDFTAAVKESDPMALLILMHWTVLIDRAGAEFWWAKDLGRRLAVGIWKAMQLFAAQSPTLLTPEWRQSIFWVCAQLRLPNFTEALG
jgi:hypothetical protein